MAAYLEHVLTLPASFHSGARSGQLMRIMTAGVNSMFLVWLSILREHFTSLVSLLILIPIAFSMNWKLALLLLALMVIYVCVNVLVIRRTSGGQAEVEARFSDISGRVGDLFGNVSVLQSFRAVSTELAHVRRSLATLLETQYPVLNWWAVMSVLTRAASSLSIVAIFALGAMLRETEGTSVGEIVAFVGFSNMLIGRLDQMTSFVMSVFFRGPQLAQFFDIMEERPGPPEKPGAPPLALLDGHVVFDEVTFRYPAGSGGLNGLTFEARPGETVALVGPTGSGKSTTLALLQRAWDPQSGPHHHRWSGHTRGQPCIAAFGHRRGVPGCRPVQPLDRREHPYGPARCQRRRDRGRGQTCRSARVHRAQNGWLRHYGGRTRAGTVRWRAAAHRSVPRAAEERSDPGPRRSHLRA